METNENKKLVIGSYIKRNDPRDSHTYLLKILKLDKHVTEIFQKKNYTCRRPKG